MDVDLKDLELLDALGRHTTLTAAAQHLFVSQPALSQRLLRLEAKLGTPLFERRGRRLEPNAAGRRLLHTARSVLGELGSAQQDIRELREGRRQPIRLTSQCTTNYQWLPPILHRFRDRMPGVEVRIEAVSDDEPIAALLDGRVDLAIVTKLDRLMDRVRLQHLFDDELVAVVPRDHPWTTQPFATAADIDEVHLALYDSYDQTRTPPVPLPVPPGAHPRRLTTLPTVTDLLIEMVAAGDVVTILPSWVAAPYVVSHDLATVQVGPEPQRRTWYSATRHGRRSEPLDALVAVLHAQLADAAVRGQLNLAAIT